MYKPTYQLLKDVHKNASQPFFEAKILLTIKGSFDYWHYGCDGFDDRGFGCGYRTLQSICSWMNINVMDADIPTIPKIQELLVQMEDKTKAFIGSRDWIGSYEVCLIVDKIFDIPSKILHVPKGNLLADHLPTLIQHFEKFGSPIMMGGDIDASSKGIFGVAQDKNDSFYLLVIDPHFYGKPPSSPQDLCENGWVQWKAINDFMNDSFYNLCMPQVSPKL